MPVLALIALMRAEIGLEGHGEPSISTGHPPSTIVRPSMPESLDFTAALGDVTEPEDVDPIAGADGDGNPGPPAEHPANIAAARPTPIKRSGARIPPEPYNT